MRLLSEVEGQGRGTLEERLSVAVLNELRQISWMVSKKDPALKTPAQPDLIKLE